MENALFCFNQRQHRLQVIGLIFDTRVEPGLLTHGYGRIEQTWVALAVEQNKALVCQVRHAYAVALHAS